MRIRFRTLMFAVPVALVAAGCGAHSTTASGAPAGNSAVPAATPATSNVALSETGATELYPLLNQWVPAYHAKYPNVSIGTGATGSGAGISQAAAGTVNIGASGALPVRRRHVGAQGSDEHRAGRFRRTGQLQPTRRQPAPEAERQGAGGHV